MMNKGKHILGVLAVRQLAACIQSFRDKVSILFSSVTASTLIHRIACCLKDMTDVQLYSVNLGCLNRSMPYRPAPTPE